jgi:hypothetical protein
VTLMIDARASVTPLSPPMRSDSDRMTGKWPYSFYTS